MLELYQRQEIAAPQKTGLAMTVYGTFKAPASFAHLPFPL
jgi:hypothetical protein